MSSPVTCDDFLGGAVRIFQPTKGYRAGIDPVLLAASVNAKQDARILDVGCGAGVASLCLAARIPDVHITGIEIMADMASLAVKSITLNHMDDRVHVMQGNIYDAGVLVETFDHVISNPPYFDKDATTPSGHASKAHANADLFGDIEGWIAFCLKRLKSGGALSVIFPTERLHHLIQAITPKGGAIQIIPFFPREGTPSKRVIVHAIKGSKKGVTCHRGFVLHGENVSYQTPIDEVLRRPMGLFHSS